MLLKQFFAGSLALFLAASALAQDKAILINKNFEGGSIGTIEKLDDTTFRCHIEGQYDERGRNRQASWHFFRMNRVLGRDVTLILTDFVGEYNDKPGATPMGPDIVPVFSYDGENWKHFPQMGWDAKTKEATLKFHGEKDEIWIAHQPPYTHAKLLGLLKELDKTPLARIEVIGRTCLGRDLHLVTVTDFDQPDAGKKTVWLQARQHAWESATSFVMEGAMKFVTSDDPKARELRKKVIFKFTPMMDPDGSALGKVRFNANGYDVNRHWSEMDLRSKERLQMMPEIWYVKKALYAYVDGGTKIDVMINMHNTETNEYLDTQAHDEPNQKMMGQLWDTLVAKTTFDPTRKLGIRMTPSNDTNSLYASRGIPVLLMEQRVGTSPKAKRRMEVPDRLQFGKDLITTMAETVLGK